MSKYNEVMDHISVDDDMKKRILQNVENKLEEHPKAPVSKAKVIPFGRYAAIAATFLVLLVGSYAVVKTTGDVRNTADSSFVYEEATEEADTSESEFDSADGMASIEVTADSEQFDLQFDNKAASSVTESENILSVTDETEATASETYGNVLVNPSGITTAQLVMIAAAAVFIIAAVVSAIIFTRNR